VRAYRSVAARVHHRRARGRRGGRRRDRAARRRRDTRRRRRDPRPRDRTGATIVRQALRGSMQAAMYLQDAHSIREGMELVQYAEEKGFAAVWQAESALGRGGTGPMGAV